MSGSGIDMELVRRYQQIRCDQDIPVGVAVFRLRDGWIEINRQPHHELDGMRPGDLTWERVERYPAS
jgi:hypothetical protein